MKLCAMAPALILGVGLAAAAAQAANLEANRTYRAGERVDSPWSGISVSIPPGFTAAYDEGAKALLMRDANGTVLAGVFGASRATVKDFGDTLVDHLTGLGIRMMPQAIDSTPAGGIEARYTAFYNGQLHSLAGTVVPGGKGNVLGVAVLGPQGDVAKLMEMARAVARSATWSTPTAAQWGARLAGVALHRSGSDSNFTRSGTDHISEAGQTSAEMHFCSNGTYSYAFSSQSFLSTGAGGLESKSSDQHQGRWDLVADFTGAAHLVLTATDGREFIWQIQETPSGAAVNGKPYRAGRSNRCV